MNPLHSTSKADFENPGGNLLREELFDFRARKTVLRPETHSFKLPRFVKFKKLEDGCHLCSKSQDLLISYLHARMGFQFIRMYFFKSQLDILHLKARLSTLARNPTALH